MKLLILKCSKTDYWYRDLVGDIFDVYEGGIGELSCAVVHPDNTDRSQACVLKEDCIIFRAEDLHKVEKIINRFKKDLNKLSIVK